MQKMERIFRFFNGLTVASLIFAVALTILSCNFHKVIRGEYGCINGKVKGINLTTDSVLIIVDSNYSNSYIIEDEIGKSYRFKESDGSDFPNVIIWNNGWQTIVLNNSAKNEIVFYSFDRKNRLRAINTYFRSCNCMIYKGVFDKHGRIYSFYNKGTSF